MYGQESRSFSILYIVGYSHLMAIIGTPSKMKRRWTVIEELRGLMSISFFFETKTIDDAHSKFPPIVGAKESVVALSDHGSNL